MSICDSEENRKKLAWLVPGYILLAWFFCVLFQPLGIRNTPGGGSRYHPRILSYREQIVYLDSDPDSGEHGHFCHNNGSIITLEEGQRSAAVIRLGRVHHHHRQPFKCSLKVRKGASLEGITAIVEEMDLPEHHDDKRQPGGHWGSFVCHDYIRIWTGLEDQESAKKLCGKWSSYDHDGHPSGAYETVPRKAVVESCQEGIGCHKDIHINIEMDGGVKDGNGAPYGLSLRQRKEFVIVVTGYKNVKVAKKVDNATMNAQNATQKSWLSEECGANEYKCEVNDYDDRHHNGKWSRSRCIWSKLKCDYHQNCGAAHDSDEAGCGYFPGNSIYDRLTPWSVSTMSLLIIVYLAIVLVLVLVTMLLLRWHKVLRTPLEVISDSRIHTVNNAFAASAAENERLDGLGGGGGGGGGGVTPGGGPGVPPTSATVSIMVMYRPNKPRGHAQPATVELPPSYESLFMEDAPPSYSLVRSSPNSSTEAEINNPEEATIVVSNSASESQMQEQPLPQQQQQHSIQEVMPSTSTSMASGVVAEALVRHGRGRDHGGVGDDNDDEHCTCDCDHTKCHNAAEAGAAAGVQPAGVDQGAVGPRD